MSNLDLSSEKVAAWLQILPRDLRELIPDEPVSVSDVEMVALADELDKSGPRRIPSVIHRHGDLLSSVGRARRIILLAWLVNRTHPNSAAAVEEVSSEGEEGESGAVGDGRKKVAPYFRQDVEAIAVAARSRIARAAIDKVNLTAIAGGIYDFQENDVMQHTGRF